jgi:hypothetical protein
VHPSCTGKTTRVLGTCITVICLLSRCCCMSHLPSRQHNLGPCFPCANSQITRLESCATSAVFLLLCCCVVSLFSLGDSLGAALPCANTISPTSFEYLTSAVALLLCCCCLSSAWATPWAPASLATTIRQPRLKGLPADHNAQSVPLVSEKCCAAIDCCKYVVYVVTDMTWSTSRSRCTDCAPGEQKALLMNVVVMNSAITCWR